MSNIVFFNHFHNGDIHVSREFVRKIINHVRAIHPSTTFSYAHKNHASLLSDIDGLKFGSIHGLVPSEHVGIVRSGAQVAVNTWYAQQNFKYMSSLGITYDCLYSIFDDHCKNLWNFSLRDISKDPSDFFPAIDYSKFHIGPAASWLNRSGKKIFISNGPTLSGQADNFTMNPIIEKLALANTAHTFILSNIENSKIQLPNVFYSSDIICKGGFDLNENSFITTHCDVIVGRASGAFTFAFVKENLFIRYPKFICFTNLPGASNKFWLSNLMKDKINYNAEIIVHDESNVSNVAQIIQRYM